MSEALICSACATPHPPSERFCPDCGLPLVHSPEVAAATPEKRFQIGRKGGGWSGCHAGENQDHSERI